jgi:hypothetical protein
MNTTYIERSKKDMVLVTDYNYTSKVKNKLTGDLSVKLCEDVISKYIDYLNKVILDD